MLREGERDAGVCMHERKLALASGGAMCKPGGAMPPPQVWNKL